MAATPSGRYHSSAAAPGDGGTSGYSGAVSDAHDLWPRPATELLLRAALLEGEAARSAFMEWLATGSPTDIGRLDEPDRRLLPLVASRLEPLGVTHPVLKAAAKLRRRIADRNQRLLRAAAGIVASLRGIGVETLALKGIPLLLEYYASPDLRPMSDVDLLIRPGDLLRTLGALAEAGWTRRGPAVPDGLHRYLCAHDLARADDGMRLDLHQYLSEYGSSPRAERGLWERSHALDLDGVRCAVPSPTDLLLHVCVASLKFGRYRNSRWVVDAAAILARSGPRIDWELLQRDARERALVLPLRECLAYLVRVLDAPVPQDALAALQQAPVGRAERLRYRVLTRHPRSLAELGREYVSLYQFGARAAGDRPGPASFLRFSSRLLLYRWGLTSARQLPRAGWRRITSRTRTTPG